MVEKLHVQGNDFADHLNRLIVGDEIVTALAIDTVFVDSGTAKLIDQCSKVLPQPLRKIIRPELQQMMLERFA